VGGRRIGSFGDITCFSFDPVKVITSIDGGAVVLPEDADAAEVEQYRFLGIDRDTIERYKNRRAWEYDVVRPGFRYHLTNVLAHVGLSQLDRVDEFIANRRRYCRLYEEHLRGLEGLVTPGSTFDDVSPFIYWVRVRDGRRLAFIEHLKERGVATGIHFMPAHRYTFYRDAPRGELSVTEQVASEIVTLPLHSFMHESDLAYICDAVRTFFA
jgi:dTDP-4-amino-4,6-dideoxygalactose transaminase